MMTQNQRVQGDHSNESYNSPKWWLTQPYDLRGGLENRTWEGISPTQTKSCENNC